MPTPKIFESEFRFCRILWDNEPISGGELVKLCEKELGWKKSTTYTVIKRLSERGVLRNESSVVTSLVSRAEAESAESIEVVERTFGGSLPSFIAAFSKSKKLSEKEINEIKSMIEKM